MKRFCDKKRQGFTMVELVVAIVIMSILATIGAIGIGGMVREYSAQMCYAARQEAAQQFISDWLEGDISWSNSGPTNMKNWFKNYQDTHDEKDISAWSISIKKDSTPGVHIATITCSQHSETEQAVKIEFYTPPTTYTP